MSLVLKESMVAEYLIKSGRKIVQSSGDANAKDLSPQVKVLDLGTDRLMDLEERRVQTGIESQF